MKTKSTKCNTRRPTLLAACCGGVLFSALLAFGAEPNASHSSAASAARTKAKPTKTSPSAALPAPGPDSASGPSKPVADSNSIAQLIEEPDGNSVLDKHLKSRLWKSRVILPADANEDAGAKQALQDLIQRLHAIATDQPIGKLAPSKPAVEKSETIAKDATASEPAPADQPGMSASQASSETGASLPPAALEKLSQLVQDPNQVRDPLEMAELLFLNNRMVEAAVFYEKALAMTSPSDPTTSEDRAWILFQLGTSLRQTNLSKARDVYLRLVSEFPNSPWTELAKANGRLITWYQTNKPEQLIAAPDPQKSNR